MAARVQTFLVIVAILFLGCERSSPSPQLDAAAGHGASSRTSPPPQAEDRSEKTAERHVAGNPPYRFPAPPRLVAIGDLHGDLQATRRALKLAGAVDAEGRWVGGELVLVQTGDQLDRGDGERAIIDWLDRLAVDAKNAGGAVHILNGNHETMNVAGDFRYVTEGGFKDFAGAGSTPPPKAVSRLPEAARGRGSAFMPGGTYAKKFADRLTIVIVGDSVFVHGGVLPEHVATGIGTINREISDWMAGTGPRPKTLSSERSPVWSRDYSSGKLSPATCKMLAGVLKALNAKRLVVGHTPQKQGITSDCDGQVWRIDVGLAEHYGGDRRPTQVLEIAGDQVQILSSPALH